MLWLNYMQTRECQHCRRPPEECARALVEQGRLSYHVSTKVKYPVPQILYLSMLLYIPGNDCTHIQKSKQPSLPCKVAALT